MSFERTDAVALVKKVTGVDVPSAFFFERKNPAAQQVVDWAERATGLKEQALRALLEAGGFTGDNAVPEGTALWRLAWVHRASSPNTSEQVVGAFLAGRAAPLRGGCKAPKRWDEEAAAPHSARRGAPRRAQPRKTQSPSRPDGQTGRTTAPASEASRKTPRSSARPPSESICWRSRWKPCKHRENSRRPS
ncbi:hypothetical protein DIPPA_13963 [Diplonema papillatum]|nr:hypothetical protein DIPPA_13963 [Diplonema papillatum]